MEEYSKEPDEEQGILKEKSSEEVKADMEQGDDDEEVYNNEGLEKLEEDDEIEPNEEAFMKGYNEGHSKCEQCGKPLDEENTIEKEIKGKIRWFCSPACEEEYENA